MTTDEREALAKGIYDCIWRYEHSATWETTSLAWKRNDIYRAVDTVIGPLIDERDDKIADLRALAERRSRGAQPVLS